jgi:hypothetical protein
MRKSISFVFITALLLGLFVALNNPVANAQDGGELVLNEWMEGQITADNFEHTYTFDGTAGDVVLIEMYRKPGEFGLDPEIELLGTGSGTLALNDDFVELGAVLVAELPTDGTYTVLARRSGGEDGSSEGAYILRASVVEPVSPGDSLTATINADDAQEIPNLWVLHPDADVTWSVSFSHEGGELYPAITLESWTGDSFEDVTVFDLTDTAGALSGTLNVSLEADTLYVLTVRKALFAFVFEDITAEVSVEIGEG